MLPATHRIAGAALVLFTAACSGGSDKPDDPPTYTGSWEYIQGPFGHSMTGFRTCTPRPSGPGKRCSYGVG